MIAGLAAMALAVQTLAGMKWQRRVVLVAAPASGDPALAEQRRILAAWQAEGAARDLTLVTVIGDTVQGSADGAAALRRAWQLPRDRFTAILIGKDGGEKLRSLRPIASTTLETTIDAMPMRRAGRR